ncbi:MAG: CopG family transcriptional regulator [Proteobacteria bacterium]|nr:CopG family transcriptional regulator [Pseudomonadota bacterium]
MRTTLAIDDDILSAAKHLAEREHKSLGEVISMLARQGLQKARAAKPMRNGVPLLPTQQAGVPVTLELVNQLRDELP